MASLGVWAGLRRRRVVDQQLWFLGRDIGAVGGNGLLRYGFARYRSGVVRGSSTYVLHGGSAMPHLVCWAFGLYVGAVEELPNWLPDAGGERTTGWSGLMLERFAGAPRLLDAPLSLAVHQLTELPPLTSVRCRGTQVAATSALDALAAHLIRYEQWAFGALGCEHRNDALRDAPRHKRRHFHQLPELSSVWQRFRQPSVV